MNERIQQLADQTGLRFTQLMSNPMVPVVHGKETDLEKFAELIIQDCIDISKGRWANAYNIKTFEDRVKHHFGVEE
jgi:hypothetical protein